LTTATAWTAWSRREQKRSYWRDHSCRAIHQLHTSSPIKNLVWLNVVQGKKCGSGGASATATLQPSVKKFLKKKG